MRELVIAKDAEELARLAAEEIVRLSADAIRSRGIFTVVLSGGSTPKLLYRLLSSEPYRNRIEWKDVFFFFGDERHVPPDSPDSNYRLAKESMFDPLAIPEQNIFRWRSEDTDPESAAEDYEKEIKAFFSAHALVSKIPSFDLILLGMGADGHTASLFPYSPALAADDRIAVANWVEKLNSFRLTLTLPVINSVRVVLFIIAGSDKSTALKEVLEGPYEPDKLPAQGVKPALGRLLFIADQEAAALMGSA